MSSIHQTTFSHGSFQSRQLSTPQMGHFIVEGLEVVMQDKPCMVDESKNSYQIMSRFCFLLDTLWQTEYMRQSPLFSCRCCFLSDFKHKRVFLEQFCRPATIDPWKIQCALFHLFSKRGPCWSSTYLNKIKSCSAAFFVQPLAVSN